MTPSKPVLEAFHNERELVLRFELAGVEPADIELRVDNRVLYVRGVRGPSDLSWCRSPRRDERSYGPFAAMSPYPKALRKSITAS